MEIGDVQREVEAATSAVDRAFQQARDRTMPHSFLARAYKQNAAAWAELRDTLIQETARAILEGKAEERELIAAEADTPRQYSFHSRAAERSFATRQRDRAAALRKAAGELK